MRFYEFKDIVSSTKPKKPDDPDKEAERQTKARADIDKARSRTQKAAQSYRDTMQADDDEERRIQRSSNP